jgi:hypothetical protein
MINEKKLIDNMSVLADQEYGCGAVRMFVRDLAAAIRSARHARGGAQRTTGMRKGLTMPKTKLKPCPFCGGEPIEYSAGKGFHKRKAYVRCSRPDHYVHIEAKTLKGARRFWDTRA